MAYEYFDSLDNDTRHRYQAKLEAAGMDQCPYRYPADVWKDDPTSWPTIEYGDIYCYLIESPGPFTHTTMKNYRSLEANNFFRSGYVQTVYFLKTKKQNFVFRAGVQRSQRRNEPMHSPWLVADPNGVILAGHCDCMAGLGESCSHVAAVMFKIEAAVRLGYTTVACTDAACKWNGCFVSDVQPSLISNINFYREEVKEKVTSKKRKRRPTANLEGCSYSEQQEFILSLLACNSKPVGLSLFTETCNNFKSKPLPQQTNNLPTPLRTLYKKEYGEMTKDELTKKCHLLAEQLTVSEAQVKCLQETTVTQSDSVTWHEQRAGRITASRAYSVLHTSTEKPSPSLILQITNSKKQNIKAAALDYGLKCETKVFETYKTALPQFHTNAKLEKTGLVLDKNNSWLGASSNGLLTCSCHGKGVVEIKCPYSAKDKSAELYFEDKNCCLDKDYHLKKGHRYYDQVQVQMFVYRRTFCAFVVKVKDTLLLDHVDFDREFLGRIVPQLKAFWTVNILPELLTRNLENQKTVAERLTETEDPTKLYCYCQSTYDPTDESPQNRLVGCDGMDCPFEWIHLSCIRPKRKTVPKGTWYCKECKKNKV